VTTTDEIERALAEGPLKCEWLKYPPAPACPCELREPPICATCERNALLETIREREAGLRARIESALADTGVIVEELHKTIDSLNKSNASWFREYERYHARDIKQRETIDKLRDENTSANALIHEYIGIHDENASLTASIARVTAELELLKDKLEDSDAANATLSVQADTFRAQLLVALGELRLLLEVLRVVECEVVDGTASLPVGRAVTTYRASQAERTKGRTGT